MIEYETLKADILSRTKSRLMRGDEENGCILIALDEANIFLNPLSPSTDGEGRVRKFSIGDRVEKKSGAKWRGKVVGFYSTNLTPTGYNVESENETGSVQIYPEQALSPAPASKGPTEAERIANAIQAKFPPCVASDSADGVDIDGQMYPSAEIIAFVRTISAMTDGGK